MKQQIVNHTSSVNETPHGQALAATDLHDLPVSEADQAEVKGGVVTIEYLVLGTFVPSPSRPSQTLVKPR